jgi:hypothetical protein
MDPLSGRALPDTSTASDDSTLQALLALDDDDCSTESSSLVDELPANPSNGKPKPFSSLRRPSPIRIDTRNGSIYLPCGQVSGKFPLAFSFPSIEDEIHDMFPGKLKLTVCVFLLYLR